MKVATTGVSILCLLMGAPEALAQANVFVSVPSGNAVKRIPGAPIDYKRPVNGVVTGDWRDAMPFGGLVKINYGNNSSRDASGVQPRLAFWTRSAHSKNALIGAPECTVGVSGPTLPVSRQTNSAGQELWVVNVPAPTNGTLRAGGADDFEVNCRVSIPDCTAIDAYAVPLISTTDPETNKADNGSFVNASAPIDQFGVGEVVTVRAPTVVHAKRSDIPVDSNGHVEQPAGSWPGYDRCRPTSTSYNTGADFECYIRLTNKSASIISGMQIDDWAIEVAKLSPGYTAVANILDRGRGFSAGAKFAWSIVSPAITLYPDGYGGYLPLLGAGFHGVSEQARADIYNRYCKPAGTDLCSIPNTPARAFGTFFPSKAKNLTQPASYLEAVEFSYSVSPNYQSGVPKCLFPGEEIRFRTMVDKTAMSAGNTNPPNKMTMAFFMKINSVGSRVYVPPQTMGPWRP